MSSSTLATSSIDWHPVRRLLGTGGDDFTLIVLNQPIRDPHLFHDLWSLAATKIAADGGANEIYNLSKNESAQASDSCEDVWRSYTDLDTIIGDLDSLSDEARAYFRASQIIHVSDQESTDFGKAVSHARRESPGREILCLGGLGGRVDQGLSQVHHLCLFQPPPTQSEGRIYLLSDASLSFVLKGGHRHRIWVREPGVEVKDMLKKITAEPFSKYVGIIPVCGPAVISTKGLEWDVQDWPTAFGGRMSTSNHVLPETEIVEVQSDIDVLFTIGLKH